GTQVPGQRERRDGDRLHPPPRLRHRTGAARLDPPGPLLHDPRRPCPRPLGEPQPPRHQERLAPAPRRRLRAAPLRRDARHTGLAVPAIIHPSPYFTTLGGGAAELIADRDGDGINDVWPQHLDNYFVPRGYAVILAHMNGTGASTGCPMHGGPGDIASMRVVIDWLQGRVVGRDAGGAEVVADWHNGKAAMIGHSYDGALANGV